jgi:hypothetical protein
MRPGEVTMIGPAEIEDMLAEYEEAVAQAGAGTLSTAQTWPVTLVPSSPSHGVLYEEALNRLGGASLADMPAASS